MIRILMAYSNGSRLVSDSFADEKYARVDGMTGLV